jgi:hypothetical protein
MASIRHGRRRDTPTCGLKKVRFGVESLLGSYSVSWHNVSIRSLHGIRHIIVSFAKGTLPSLLARKHCALSSCQTLKMLEQKDVSSF